MYAEQSLIEHSLLLKIVIAVAVLLFFGCLKILLGWREQRTLEATLASQHGCKEPPKLRGKWPFSLDLLIQSIKADRRNQILRFFISVLEKTGSTHAQILLGARGINTIDPENVEVILSTQFRDYSLGSREQNFRPLLGHGIFTQNGAAWKASRDLLRPIFNHQRTEYFSYIKIAVSDLLSSIISEVSKAQEAIDLQYLFFLLTLDVTTAAVLGASTKSLQDQGSRSGLQFANAFDKAQHYLAVRGRLGHFYWILGGKNFRDACNFVHGFVDNIVAGDIKMKAEEATSCGQKREGYLFIDALIRETSDAKVVRDQLVNVLLAGRDTTACLLSWTFRLIALHPNVQRELRAECLSLPSHQVGDLPTKEELKNMCYLRKVINEVLRLYPSVPINMRQALKPTVLPVGGGPDGKAPMLVRKGEAVGYCVYAMHRRKDLYGDDADEFRPDRWDSDPKQGPDLSKIGWGYLPFNGGPRVCLGQEFAMLEASYAIVRLLQTFPRIRLAEGETEYEKTYPRHTVTLVVASANGCKVHLDQ